MVFYQTFAFSFESTMGKLRRLISGSRNIISEVVRKFIQKQKDKKCKSNIDPSINDSIYSLGETLTTYVSTNSYAKIVIYG